MSRSKSKRFPWLRILLACVVIAGALAGYYYVWGPGSLPAVKTAKVTRGDLRAELSATGVVKAEEVKIASEAPARITLIAVRESDQVRRGQLLVQLDRSSLEGYMREAQARLNAAQAQARGAEQAVRAERANAAGAMAAASANLRAAQAQLERLQHGARPQEIRAAEARVQQAQAALDQARADLGRLETLHRQGAISAQALDQGRTAAEVATAQLDAARQELRLLREGARAEDIAAAQAQVESARAAVDQARALERTVELRRREAQAAQAQVQAARSQVSVARAQLDRAEIRAPLDATVVRVDAKTGEVAYPGVALMALSDLSRMWVEAEIDDVDLDKAKLGQEVTVLAEAFPGRRFTGHVYEIAKSAEPKLLGRVRAKIVRAKIRLDDPAPLTAQMEVDVESRPVVARRALLAPNGAVQSEGDSRYAFVVNGQHVKRVPVRIGAGNFEHTQIIAGLREGQVVAVPGDMTLRNSQRVKVKW
jgi:RND family efflux transporter MFP subunit